MTPAPKGLRRLFRDHGLSIVLVALFVASMIGQAWSGWKSRMVVFSIFLRQRGSPESKPVATPTWETAD